MKNIILMLFVFCNTLLFSQNNDKKEIIAIFNKTSQKYNTTNLYQTTMNYSLYPTYSSKKSTENFKGIAIKNGKEYYSKLAETEIVNLATYQIKIDNENKLMQYSKSSKNDSENAIVNVNDYLKNFSKFELSNNKEEWICTLSTPSFSFIPYTKVVVYINKADYTISKQTLYLITTKKYKTTDGTIKEDYPRVEIVYEEFKTKDVVIGNLFSVQNYLSINKNKTSPSNNYKGYVIVD